MAELKFLRGSYTSWSSGWTKDKDSFYIVEEQDGRFSLYLGEKFLCDGVSKADLAAAVEALEDADSALDARVKSLETLMGGEGIGSVADQIKAAIEKLDAEVTSKDGTHVTVKVTEVGGVITAVNVTESDIASAQALADEVSARTDADKAITDRLDVIEGDGEGSIKKAVADAKSAIKGELAETDAKTLAALNDRIDTVVADGKTYSIAAVTGDELSALGANVKEAFKLVDEDGTKAGEVIKVYKDSALQSVVLDGQELVFTYLLANGQNDVVRVDVSNFLAESEFADGLKVVDHVVSVKVDAASESFLTVGADGVKLSGVQDAIDDAVSAEAQTREKEDGKLSDAITAEATTARAAEKANADAIDTEKSRAEGKEGELAQAITAEAATARAAEAGLQTQINTEVTARTAADDAINAKIGDVAEGETVVGMIAAAKAAATTKVVEGTDGGNNLEVASAKSEDGSVTYTINLTDVASAQALDDEATTARAAEEALAGRLDVIEGEGEGSIKKAVADEKTRAEKAESDLSDRVASLEDNTITGSTNVVASTDDKGDTTISLQWGTF